MKCERCAGLMQEEPLVIVGESFTQRWLGLATYHCMSCERIEYGTTPAEAALKTELALATYTRVAHSPGGGTECQKY